MYWINWNRIVLYTHVYMETTTTIKETTTTIMETSTTTTMKTATTIQLNL